MVVISPRSGAETESASDATAYLHRDTAHHLLIEARWSDPKQDDDHIAWTRAFHEAVQPYTIGAATVNYLTHDEDEKRLRAAYGDNYGRLIDVTDPENVFRMNQNIEPSG